MRLREAREQNVSWKKWGPYLSERQWGTVREDYSDSGDAWNFFTHDQARSRAYRWGEDGLAGISDDEQHLCFALALWNDKDPILKERLFGVTKSEGNHGEVMRGERDPAVEALSADVRKILGLDPHGKDFSVVYGAVSRNDKEIAILTRSILEVIIDLPAVIQVPAAHVEEKRVSPTYVEEAVKSGKIPPLIRIQSSSGKHKDAFVSIQYRDTYFWIDDRDLRSKKLFSFLIFIFTLVETEEKGTAPIATVPTN